MDTHPFEDSPSSGKKQSSKRHPQKVVTVLLGFCVCVLAHLYHTRPSICHNTRRRRSRCSKTCDVFLIWRRWLLRVLFCVDFYRNWGWFLQKGWVCFGVASQKGLFGVVVQKGKLLLTFGKWCRCFKTRAYLEFQPTSG